MDTSRNRGIVFQYPPTEGLVSVIIPTFNRENSIVRSVESVLKQTYKNLEVIVVDDGSSDGTLSCLEKVQDARLRVVSMPVNGGAPAARNYGISLAKGAYIALQDSDDVWLPEKLALQQAFLEEGGYDFVFCQSTYYGNNGSFRLHPPLQLGIEPERDWLKEFMSTFVISTQKFFGKRCVFERVSFDESLKVAQDRDFCLQVAGAGFAMGYLVKPLVNVYANQDSITFGKNYEEKYRSYEGMVKKYEEELKNNPQGRAFFAQALGDLALYFDKKLAIKHFQESLRLHWNYRVFGKLQMVRLGLRK